VDFSLNDEGKEVRKLQLLPQGEKMPWQLMTEYQQTRKLFFFFFPLLLGGNTSWSLNYIWSFFILSSFFGTCPVIVTFLLRPSLGLHMHGVGWGFVFFFFYLCYSLSLPCRRD
jgi:hypothetical protein